MSPQFLSESKRDHKFFDRELASFLPDRIFDDHAHLWRHEWLSWSLESVSDNVGYQEYQQAIQAIPTAPVSSSSALKTTPSGCVSK